ncbi:MAG: TlpA family protein disulfide reductase [Muribaculaceae bacterium]|nr:TlpA family protein disulfide reductase [Muribaculaceae bacterium]
MKRYIITIISIIAIAIANNKTFATTLDEEILPVPQWKEGSAIITGQIINYQSNDKSEAPHVYPRSSLGRYADRTHGYGTIDSTGNFRIDVHIYQTHQPCFMTVPGYYGLVYVSPGDSITLVVDQQKRRDHGFHGDDGSVIFSGGEDADINNLLASNFGHDAVWDNFFNAGGMSKKYASNEALTNAVMAHRDKRLRHIDSHVSSPRLKEVLSLNINGDAIRDMLSAPTYRCASPDTAYYSFITDMDVCNPKYRWASDYDGIIRFVSNLRMSDDSYPLKRSYMSVTHTPAYLYEDLIASGKLTPEESSLLLSYIKHNIDKIPANIADARRIRIKECLTSLCDSLRLNDADSIMALRVRRMVEDEHTAYGKVSDAYETLLANIPDSIPDRYSSIINDDEFGKEAEAYFSSNRDKIISLLEKYNTELQLFMKKRKLIDNLKRFSDITGINSGELMENVRMYPYSNMIEEGDTVPEEVFRNELKNLSEVQTSFLKTQNDFLKEVLAKAVSNVSQMSPDDDADRILINLTEKHKGKMVFIDIWNTWCGVCISDIQEHEQFKGKYADDVAFVYLADESSQESVWNERIKKITGDHYRLPQLQMQALMQKFSFTGFPSYILIDKNGEIVHTGHVFSLPNLLDSHR